VAWHENVGSGGSARKVVHRSRPNAASAPNHPPYRARIPAKRGKRTPRPATAGTFAPGTLAADVCRRIPAKRVRQTERRRGVQGREQPRIGQNAIVYFTDRGIEELSTHRGEEQVSLEWLAQQLRTFVDLHPDFETPIERLATWLARLDDDED